MKTKLLLLLLLGASLSGCAKLQNQIAANGGFFGTYAGDYVVRNDSGGRIMDVWVLRNVIVQADEHGAGYLFRDQAGNVIHLGGDVKVIRVNDGVELAKYHDYHAEFSLKTYQESFHLTLQPTVE